MCGFDVLDSVQDYESLLLNQNLSCYMQKFKNNLRTIWHYFWNIFLKIQVGDCLKLNGECSKGLIHFKTGRIFIKFAPKHVRFSYSKFHSIFHCSQTKLHVWVLTLQGHPHHHTGARHNVSLLSCIDDFDLWTK